jgi:prepilin-type N-terminal cleavage/methylation domain-containing protein/prepilin-type processing-associated H-X9-DG protein
MRSHRAFTLIELLTVIAIIGVLAGLLIPVVGAVRSKARSTACLSNMRQVGAASLLYLNDYKGRLPSSSHDRADDGSSRSWRETLKSYLGPEFIGRCPARPDHIAEITYSWNDFLTDPQSGLGMPYGACRQPSATLMLAERADDDTSDHFHFREAPNGVSPARFRAQARVDVHGSASNYLFVDGHVESLSVARVNPRLTGANALFIVP